MNLAQSLLKRSKGTANSCEVVMVSEVGRCTCIFGVIYKVVQVEQLLWKSWKILRYSSGKNVGILIYIYHLNVHNTYIILSMYI